MDRKILRRVLSLALLLMGCLPAIAGSAVAPPAPGSDGSAQAGPPPAASAQAAPATPTVAAAPAAATVPPAAPDSTAPKGTAAPATTTPATPAATEPRPAAAKAGVDPLARRGEMRADSEPVPDSVKVVLNQPAVEDIPLQINSDVLHYIEFFTGAGRSTFERWLKRSGRYMELFRTVLQKEGLPPDLVHLVFVESGFNLNARSYASAVGPWQFMRGSARLFGLNVNQWVDERKDPEKATVAAARYLKHLYGIFGDWPLAIASYNSGEGTVLRAIKAQGTTNYWDLKLPKQTEQYVPQFMAALAITRDPVKYGFSEVEFDDPMRFDEIAFNGNVDLRSVAKLCDCSVEDLRTLNPAYRGVAVKGTNGVSVVRVPEGKSELIHQRLADGAKLSAASVTVRHRVQRKETLRSIASEYSVSARRLAAANGIGRHHPLRRGMLLTIPASAPSAVPQVVDATDPSVSTAYVPPRKIGLPAHLSGNSNASNRTNHIVKKGETLYQIAQDAGVTAEQVQQWNHLKGTNLSVGQRLRVHSADDVAITEAAAASDSAQIAALHVSPRRGHHRGRHHRGAAAYDDSGSSRHTVRSGETLGTIAKKYGVSVSALRRANGLRSSNVRAGQRLRVPGA
jgi:membrane-bound lytic murein transglycosylase D